MRFIWLEWTDQVGSWEILEGRVLIKETLHMHQKFKEISVSCDTAFLLPRIYPKELIIDAHNESATRIFSTVYLYNNKLGT